MSRLADCVEILDSKRIPLSAKEREKLKKIYPYYGAQGIIDYVEDYLFDGEYILVAEDGNNLRALNENIATWATGKFWVNNHAHILGSKEGYSLKYIYYLISCMDLRGYITGSAQPKLSQENLVNIGVSLPEKSVQDKVSSTLSSIDEKIGNNHSIIAELEKMANFVYEYWFLQFNFPDENGHPYNTSGGKMVWNENLKRNIPSGWKVGSIGDILEDRRGISYSSETIEGDGVPMINLASFSPEGQYNVEGLKKYSGDYAEDKVLKPYDLVICNTQQTAINFKKDIIGKALLVPDIFDGDIVYSHHVTFLRVYDDDMKYYLFRLFNTEYFHKFVTGYANGTNILGLLFDSVKQCEIEIPDKRTLCKFAKIMHTIERKKADVIKENQELEKLRDFLLPLLMSGQVKFNDK